MWFCISLYYEIIFYTEYLFNALLTVEIIFMKMIKINKDSDSDKIKIVHVSVS